MNLTIIVPKIVFALHVAFWLIMVTGHSTHSHHLVDVTVRKPRDSSLVISML